MINDPIQKTVSTMAYGVSFSTAAGGAASVSELALWIGILFAALTFLVNWGYQAAKNNRDAAKDKRDKELHDLEAELIKVKMEKLTDT